MKPLSSAIQPSSKRVFGSSGRETISDSLQGLNKQQDKEMKDHNTEWKKRRKFYDKLKNSIMEISSGIDAIIQ